MVPSRDYGVNGGRFHDAYHPLTMYAVRSKFFDPEPRGRPMISRPCRPLALLILMAVMANPLSSFASGDSEDGFEQFGDIMQFVLPIGAAVSTVVAGDGQGSMWDKEGTKQYAYSFGTAWASTYLLKISVQKMRPNQGARASFPSGHTMAAFSGASFFGARYGWKYGLPAYTLATLTGVSRVYSSWHYADDVVAGASISMLSTWLYTTPHHSRLQVRPTYGADGVGVAVAINGPGRGRSEMAEDQLDYLPMEDRRFQYGFQFGPALLIRNEISSPSDGGTQFDLNDFEKRDDPTTTAAVGFDWFAGDRWTLQFFYSPFESQDNGQFSETVDFAGETFPAETDIQSAWRLHDMRARASFHWRRGEKFNLGIGAGVIGQHHYIRLTAPDVESRVDDLVILPYAHVRASYTLFKRWSLVADVDWMEFQSDKMLNGAAGVLWQVDPRWQILAGYQFYDRDIQTDTLANRVSYDMLILGFAHSWK